MLDITQEKSTMVAGLRMLARTGAVLSCDPFGIRQAFDLDPDYVYSPQAVEDFKAAMRESGVILDHRGGTVYAVHGPGTLGRNPHRPTSQQPGDLSGLGPPESILRQAYSRGRREVAVEREYARGRGDEGQMVNHPECAPSARAKVSAASPEETASNSRPVAPAATIDQLFEQHQARNQERENFARRLTAPEPQPPDDPIAIGREALRLRVEKPALTVVEAIGLVRERRGLPAHRI
jgi:hypothetical protein